MQSLYDDIFATLSQHAFSIPNVKARKPYDATPKTYPLIVVHEIVNLPKETTTVQGEARTALSYQLDILTMACVDNAGVTLSAWDAGRRLAGEVTDLLAQTYSLTRRTIRTESPASDIVAHIWRGDALLDLHGYSYRR